MITKEKGLDFTEEKLMSRTIGILEHRDQYFMDMINQLKKRYPTLKIIYANSATGAVFDANKPTPDFVLILKGTLVSNDPKKPPKRVVMFDMPLLFTDRTIAGWTLAVEAGNIEGYFKYMFDKMVRIDENRFMEYLIHMALLSTDPQNELYWKSPDNTDKLVRELMELYARYATKDSSKLQDTRGYQPPILDKQHK